MKTFTLSVSGMHCASCEVLLEKSLKKIPNITSIKASEKTWIIEIGYETVKPEFDRIESIIIENGYTLGVSQKRPWISTDIDDYTNVMIAGIIVYILFILLRSSNWPLSSLGNSSSPTLGVAFLVGLTAGVSSCMALIGWLILGISARWNKDHANASMMNRIVPHFTFHSGRIVGFAILGGMLGLFGWIIHFSSLFLGATTAIVGVIMILLGLNLTNISPRLGSFSLKLPKIFGQHISGEGESKWSTFLTGAATFFLPCGFTLAMQAYAITTGSFITGALVLAFFALGTTPWLLSIGFISAIFRGEWLKQFFTFTGVIVLILGAYNISNGTTLLSLSIPSTTVISPVDDTTREVQEVRMTQDDNGYSPSTLSIDAGKKIRWIITGKSPYACSSQIVVPQLHISKSIQAGENVIEFIAPESGEIPFSCSMGMYRGKFTIVNKNVSNTPQEIPSVSTSSNGSTCGMMTKKAWSASSGGCGMMGGKTNTPATQPSATPSASPSPSIEANTIAITYTSAGMSPGEIHVKKGETVTLVVDVKDTISGCMHMMLIPWFDENAQPLDAGTQLRFTITPKESGRFPITCAMSVPHGFFVVE